MVRRCWSAEELRGARSSQKASPVPREVPHTLCSRAICARVGASVRFWGFSGLRFHFLEREKPNVSSEAPPSSSATKTQAGDAQPRFSFFCLHLSETAVGSGAEDAGTPGGGGRLQPVRGEAHHRSSASQRRRHHRRPPAGDLDVVTASSEA